MTILDTDRFVSQPRERFSRRFVNGVEILEHEMIQKITINEGRFETRGTRTPRLIINDAVSATRDFISKTRSDIADLDTFLRNPVRSSAKAK